MKKFILVVSILFLTGCSQSIETTLVPSNDNLEVFEEHIVKDCLIKIDGEEHKMDVVFNNVDVDVIGNYLITYEYNLEDKVFVCQRVVFVSDQTEPVLALNPGIDTVKVGSQWVDPGVVVTDNYDTTALDVIVETTLDTSTIGSYTVIYKAVDSSMNQGSIERIVNVIE